MTYSSGGLIQATDFNGFVSTTAGANVNATWNSTYGQTALSTVSAAATVSATNWATLNTTIASMANHQATTITSRSGPTAGSTIAIQSAVNTDITNCYNNRYNAYAVGSQNTGWTGTASQTAVTGHRNTTWTITFTDTMTFANATAATNFFGSGGLVKIQFSKSSTGFPADASWNSLATAVCGAVWFTSDSSTKTISGVSYNGTKVIGGSGTPTTLGTAIGYNQLTGVAQTIYKQFNTSYVYTGEYIQVDALKSGATVTFTTSWFSPARNVAGTSNEISGGTATTGISFGTAPTTVVTYFPPETVYLTNTWGTPTVVSSVSAPVY
jgi:hypothetical protein